MKPSPLQFLRPLRYDDINEHKSEKVNRGADPNGDSNRARRKDDVNDASERAADIFRNSGPHAHVPGGGKRRERENKDERQHTMRRR